MNCRYCDSDARYVANADNGTSIPLCPLHADVYEDGILNRDEGHYYAWSFLSCYYCAADAYRTIEFNVDLPDGKGTRFQTMARLHLCVYCFDAIKAGYADKSRDDTLEIVSL